MAAWVVRRLFLHSVEQAGSPNLAMRRIGRVLQAIIVIVGLLAIFAALNVDVSSVIVGLGGVSIAVSFALSTLLNNLVAGVLIVADDSVRVGDTIRIGVLAAGGPEGRVVRMRTRATELETTEGRRIFVPNGYLAQNPVLRVSRAPRPWSPPLPITDVGERAQRGSPWVSHPPLQPARSRGRCRFPPGTRGDSSRRARCGARDSSPGPEPAGGRRR